MQPDNNEFRPQTNTNPEPQPQQVPQPQSWQSQTPVTPQTQPVSEAEAPTQPIPNPVAVEQPQVAPQSVQPTQPAFAPQQPGAPIQQPAQDPGKVFSILGLVFAFIAFQLPGLILSIIGLKKSKKAGFPTTLAVVGIILNSLFMVVGLGIIAAFTLAAYNGIQQRAQEQGIVTIADSIYNRTEAYYAANNSYPTIDQLRNATGAAALEDDEKAALKDTATPTDKEVGYQSCTDATGAITGAKIYVRAASDQQVTPNGIVGICDENAASNADATSSTFEQQ